MWTLHANVLRQHAFIAGAVYLQAAEKWAFLSHVRIHGDDAWHKGTDHGRAKCLRTVKQFKK